MKTVITYGTFDLLHIGHIRLLQRAKNLGDFLIVGVSTDEFNALKNKRTVISFKERIEIVKSLRYVDKVIAEKSWEQKVQDIKKYGVNIFVIGDDWKGKFDFLRKYCNVVYLERTKEISTTQIQLKIGKFD